MLFAVVSQLQLIAGVPDNEPCSWTYASPQQLPHPHPYSHHRTAHLCCRRLALGEAQPRADRGAREVAARAKGLGEEGEAAVLLIPLQQGGQAGDVGAQQDVLV